jgi:IBR domain, a half RING-finger domain
MFQRQQNILYTHSCGHINCKGCLKQLFRTALRDITMLPLRCCEVEIDLTPVKSILNEDEAALLLQRNSESKVKEKMHCPQCNLFINLDNLPSQRKTITCTGCLTSLCSECRTRSHQFRTCSENKADNQSTSDKALFNLASSKGWKQCPMCRVIIELEYGCNHMTCSFCRFHFCFKCLKPWSTATGKCSSGACEVWDANKLIQAGDDRIVNEELVLGRQYRPEERVARQMVHVRALRSNETCRHTWVRRNGNQGACEACGYSLWLYGMVCQGACNATVCYTCARHRIAAIGWR